MTRNNWHRVVRVLLVGLFAATMSQSTQEPAQAADSARPVLAYYYGWWTPSNWTKTSDLPPAPYDSNSDAVMRRQIEQARAAGITAYICTWEYNCVRLLQLAEEMGGFSVAITLDSGANGAINTPIAYAAAMGRVADLTSNPAYLRWNGKPVIVFWNHITLPGDNSLAGWQTLRGALDPGHNQFWLGGGDNFDYLDVFDAFHYYDISWEAAQGSAMAGYASRLSGYNSSHGTSKPFIATVMPGYDDIAYRNGHQRDRENGGYYRATWSDARDYNAAAVIVTSWNEWYEGSQIEPSVAYGTQYLDITKEEVALYRTMASGFADSAFRDRWDRTDLPVHNDIVDRSWVWGYARSEAMHEPADGGTHLVQYFDKSRMEINDPNGDRSQEWFVTNGLLVKEMIEGRIQVGQDDWVQHGASEEVLAGDPRAFNPDVPSYASLAGQRGAAGDRRGQAVTTQLKRDGSTATISAPSAVTLVEYEGTFYGHNVADVFWSYMNQQGPIYDGSGYVNGLVVNWVFAFGYPITEPVWVRTKLGGTDTWVLVQAFERRVLTYTPTNPAAYQVEMGNVGQHYHQWRFGWAW